MRRERNGMRSTTGLFPVNNTVFKTKICTRCNRRKVLTKFSKATGERLETAARCKACVAEEYRKNRVSRCATMRRWYVRNREHQLEVHAVYYKNHKDRILKSVKTWQSANIDKVKEYKRKHRKTNPNLSREIWQRRRARLLGVTYYVLDKHAWEFVCAMWENKCVYCTRVTKLTQDHIIPLSKGGWHDLDNLVPACARCNSVKGATILHGLQESQ